MPVTRPNDIILEQAGRNVTVTLNYPRQSVSFSFVLEPPAAAVTGTEVLDLDNLQAVNINGNLARPQLVQALRETQRDLRNELEQAKRERDFYKEGGKPIPGEQEEDKGK